jgi:hypothetical protein
MLYGLLKEQKQHFLSPCHCRLAKLSFVKITPLYKYHKKTLILRGSLSFHIKVLYGIASAHNNALYMDLTENNPFWCSPHTKRPLWFINCTSTTIVTTSCHACKLTPTRDLLKATFNGVVDITILTEAPFRLTILYRAGKSDFKGRGLIHASSQNRIEYCCNRLLNIRSSHGILPCSSHPELCSCCSIPNPCYSQSKFLSSYQFS